MFYGKLNDEASGVGCTFTYSAPRAEGRPLDGEGRVYAKWTDFYDMPARVEISLGTPCFLDTVSVMLGEKAKGIVRVSLLSEEGKLLADYRAETGKTIGSPVIRLPVGDVGKVFSLKIEAPFADLAIDAIDLFGATDDVLPLYPAPKEATFGSDAVDAGREISITLGTELAARAAEVLSEKLSRRGKKVVIKEKCGFLTFLRDYAIPKNGYYLKVTPDWAVIEAPDERGFVIGAEAFVKLLSPDGRIRTAEIIDTPFKAFRGVHLYLPAKEDMPFAKRLIRDVVSPMGYNAVILEIAGGMRFDSHPEITEAVLRAKAMQRAGKLPAFAHGEVGGDGVVEKKDVAEFCDYIRSFGLDLIPEVQTLGHVQFMTAAHPEIAERTEEDAALIDQRSADVPPDKFYPHCYCPSNEKSYEIAFDLLREILEVTRPEHFVHMGHDEVYQIGVCPLCRGKDPAALYAEDIGRYHKFLKERGLRMMIWSDMISPASAYTTRPAIRMIPKDVLLLDFIWYFHPDKDIETALCDEGFEVAVGNLYSSHFPRYEERIRRGGMTGGEVSCWTRTREEELAREGKIYDMLLTAGMLWSAGYRKEVRQVFDRKIRADMPALRASLRDKAPLTGEEVPLYSRPFDDVAKVAEKTVPIGRFTKALRFDHAAVEETTRLPWVPLEEIGAYRILYEDGEEAVLPLFYAGNVGYFGRRQTAPLPYPYYRHNGYISTYFTDAIETRREDGGISSLYRLEWENPHPEKKILSVTYEKIGDKPAVALYRVAAVL